MYWTLYIIFIYLYHNISETAYVCAVGVREDRDGPIREVTNSVWWAHQSGIPLLPVSPVGRGRFSLWNIVV